MKRAAAFIHQPLPLSTRRSLFRVRHRHSSSASHGTCTILVPGKFDALHLGHRHLVTHAARLSSPTLLSFSGMAASLKWAPRPPIVAPGERSSVLKSWSYELGCKIEQKSLPFEDVRYLQPHEFLSLITSWGVKGVVCGEDWRFGVNASGNVEDLKRLSEGLEVLVVEALEVDGGVVSSTRVRSALREGNMEEVRKCLGRSHRCVGVVSDVGNNSILCDEFVNTLPGDGEYKGLVRVLGRREPFESVVRVTGDTAEVLCEESVFCIECETMIDFLSRA